MSLHRRNPKRDRNERAIVAALASCGAASWRLSGPGLPDLLVAYRGRWRLVEVKAGRRQLEPQQVAFHALATAAGLPCDVVRTPDDALALVATWT